jgi:anti-sigma regulatory factor (Ser/Thr protein kinase)
MFRAERSELASLKSFLEQFCTEEGVPREACLRLNVVLEELFVNTVKHGRRGDGAPPVWVSLAAEGARVQVLYEDAAPPFNPYAWLATGLSDATKPGGLGVLLTRELSATRDYAYLFGRNRIRLRV